MRQSQLDLPEMLDAEQFLADGRRASSSRSPVKTRSPSRIDSLLVAAPALTSTPGNPLHSSPSGPAAAAGDATRSPAKGEPEPEVIVIDDDDDDEMQLVAAARESLAEYLHETQLAPHHSDGAAGAEFKPAGAGAPMVPSADEELSQDAEDVLDLQLVQHSEAQAAAVEGDGEELPATSSPEPEGTEDSLPPWPVDAQHEFEELLRLDTTQLLRLGY